jgi:hypothetical protein
MTTAERQALNGLLANKQYYDARSPIQSSAATGTMVGIDGQTGRAIAVVADGTARFNQIASSSQIGVTSAAYSKGTGGNGGFLSGRSV